MTILVRPRAWWINKVPLSVLTGLLLVDGTPLRTPVLAALLALVGTVCSVANYGYAINELFDREEDRRGGRTNAAAAVGARTVAAIVVASAALALVLSTVSAGRTGGLLTIVELLIPLAYSVPPIRAKNREWMGVVCDAVAAHLYPVLLALAIVAHLRLRTPTVFLVLIAAAWSLMTGIRGILSHQLQSEAHDRAAGLFTVVHRFGHARVAGLVTGAVLPLEIVAFGIFVSQCDVTAIVAVVAVAFLLYELLKFALDAFPVVVFTRSGGRYLPFVDEGAYKVWGPLALVLDAASNDLRYLVFAPLYVALFQPRIAGEWQQIRATARLVRHRVDQLVVRGSG